MITKQNIPTINSLENLVTTIQETNSFFLNTVQRQVNTALTLRNWMIGFYIVEYEQSGRDRADYGKQLYKAIADRLTDFLKKDLNQLEKDICTSAKTFTKLTHKFCGRRPQNLTL
ncbi:MAG: hypothetical protein ABIN97_13385 [Ginsengibacter sp.]